MAKGKGKSRRRIKDWAQRYLSEGDVEDDQAPREGFIRREFKIPQRELSVGAEELDDLPRTDGMVIAEFPGGALVRVEGKDLICGIAGTYRPPEGSSALALGDIVTVALIRSQHLDGQTAMDKDRAEGVILQRYPRETVLLRPQPRSGKRRDAHRTETFEKIIAANMDTLLIVSSTRQPPLRAGLIDRFLIIAQRGDLDPVLVINKIDLAAPDGEKLQHFEDLALEVLFCSAVTGEGLDGLLDRLSGKRSVFAGASGVGKSTIINAIIPGADAPTRAVRKKDQRGRHKTSNPTIYELAGGGIIVDTPGIRELGIGLPASELPWYFPEFEALGGSCKFRNCTHTHEPDCAVLAAVESGQIARTRYESYLNIRQTIEEDTG